MRLRDSGGYRRRFRSACAARRHLTCVVILPLFAACGVAPSESEPITRARQAVTGGIPSGVEDDAVVQIRVDDNGSVKKCTGTLVAPDLVLTARHCISYYRDGQFDCSIDGLLEGSVDGAGVMNAMYPPSAISICTGADCLNAPEPDAGDIAVGKQVFGLPTASICQSDIALVWLDRALDFPVMPIRLDTATRPGETIRAVGYGENSDGLRGLRGSRSGIPVITVAKSPLLPEGGPIPRGTFVVGPGPCQGDSGGPALSEPTSSAGQGAIVGVFSILGYPCASPTTRNYYTQVAVFRDFLLDAFATVGRTPLLETRSEGGATSGGTSSIASTSVAGSATGGATANGEGGAAGAAFGGADLGGAENAGASDAVRPRSPAVGCMCQMPASNRPRWLPFLLVALATLPWARKQVQRQIRD